MKLWSKMKPADKFADAWERYGFSGSDMVKEYAFHPERKWRLDFAWPSCRLGVEIHGFGAGGRAGGHQAIAGLAEDCTKAREAALCDWLVISFTSRCVGSQANARDAVELVCKLIERRHNETQRTVASSL